MFYPAKWLGSRDREREREKESRNRRQPSTKKPPSPHPTTTQEYGGPKERTKERPQGTARKETAAVNRWMENQNRTWERKHSRQITNSTLHIPSSERTLRPPIPHHNRVARNPQSLTRTFHTRIPQLRPPLLLRLLHQPFTLPNLAVQLLRFRARFTRGWFQKRSQRFPSERKMPVSDVYPRLHEMGIVKCVRGQRKDLLKVV